MDNIKFKTDNLTKLLRSLKGDDNKVVRVGIIGSKAQTSHGKNLTNAQLGTFHEFGGKNDHPPRRSFLEDSLKLKLDLKEDKGLKKSAFKNVFQKGKTDTFLTELGARSVQIIENGFLTAGYGRWKPLSKSTWSQWERKAGISGWRTARSIATFRKGLKKSLDRTPLIDTGKLKGSISFKIVKK